MQLLRCTIGDQAVLVEQESFVEQLPLTGEPELVVADQVYHFSKDLNRLCQGITGLAVLDNACLPIVSLEYFQPERAPTFGVRAIDRLSPVAPAAAGLRRFFVFNVPGAIGFQFALSMSQVLEVTRALPMAPLNFGYSHYVGVAVWRGETIPVVDLAFAAKVGAIRSDTPWGRSIIVRNQANKIFAIAARGQVRQQSAAAQVHAPDSVSVRPMRGVRGVFRFEGSPLLVPDLDALVE